MASILSGFEYDIFISYRHNDNLDGWVTDFVFNLEKELKGTLKETVTIYFDRNPQDGLLETHNVDKSLEGKLKCLILIPIISQTYCDPKSFAWQHEFCSFNSTAKDDAIGRDIRLSNGNVASRILPVRIHDLDAEEDKKLLEHEMGGVLRAVDFIYKEAGVNRPLKPSDNKNDNLCKTDYRNQVNKVANATKEVIMSIKNPVTRPGPRIIHPITPPSRRTGQKVFVLLAILLSLSLAGYLIFQAFFLSNKEAPELNTSLAVLPFDNLSDGSDEYLSEGITDQLITSLGHIKELKVASRTSAKLYKKSPLTIEAIASQLKVGYILEGSVQKIGGQLKISVRLIRANDNFQKWSETYLRDFKDILSVQDGISQKVAESLGQVLKLSMLKADKPNNTEAYDHYLRGEFLWKRVESINIREAISEFKKAVKSDPQFSLGYTRIGLGYLLLACPWGDSNIKTILDSAIFYNELGLKLNPDLSDGLYTKATIVWWAQKNFTETEELIRQSIQHDSYPNPLHLLDLGFFLNSQGRAQEGLQYCIDGSNLDPSYIASYTFTGDSYFMLKQYDKAEAKYKEGLGLYPTNTDMIYRLVWLYCCTNRFREARDFLEQKKGFLRSRDPRPQTYLAIANSKLGNQNESDQIIKNLFFPKDKNVSVFDLNLYQAVYYSATAQKEKMYNALEKSVKENETDLIWLKVDPAFEPFRNEPRFKGLLQKIGFNVDP